MQKTEDDLMSDFLTECDEFINYKKEHGREIEDMKKEHVVE